MRRTVTSTLVGLLTLALAAACGGDDGNPVPEETSPSASESPGATRTPAVDILPTGGGQIGQDLPPGVYQPPGIFDVPFTITVGQGWRSGRDDREELLALLRGENSVGRATSWLAFFVFPEGTTPDDVVAEAAATPMAEAEEPIETTVGGVAGTSIDLQALPNPEEQSDIIEPGTIVVPAMDPVWGADWHTESAEARIRLIAVEVDGRTFVAYVEAPEEEFDDFAVAVDEVLSSLQFVS